MGLLDELKKLTKPYSGEEYDDFGDEFSEAPPESSIPVSESARRSSYSAERRNPFSDYDNGRNYDSGRGNENSRSYESGRSYENSRSYDGGRSYDSGRTPIPQRRDKVVNLNPASQVQMVIVKPERFESAAEIADHLRDRRPVLINLEQTQKETARRLIDFLSGVAYALDGKIRKVAVNTYIITPYNVDVMGDLIDELENTSLYM